MKRSAVHFTGLSGHSVENGDGRDASRETSEKAGASVSDEEQARTRILVGGMERLKD